MDEREPAADLLLRDLSTRIGGSRRSRARLMAELRDHLDDAVVARVNAGMERDAAEQEAIEALGSTMTLGQAWEARRSQLRRRNRAQIALLVGTAALAAALGVAQHADGRRNPATTPTVSPTTVSPSGLSHARPGR